MDVVDAVVIGAGPNGLVAANRLADAGWRVLVLEEQPVPGGAVRSDELTHPGFVHDVCSAFYPLAAASPVIRSLELESYGLRWRWAPLALAHPGAGGRCAVLSTDLDETAASLDVDAPGDGDAWRRLYSEFALLGDPLLVALTSPMPAIRGLAGLVARLGPRRALDVTRLALSSVRQLGQERFRGQGGALLLAGNALHTDLSPDAPPSAFFGWMLASLGQRYGFPVPEGGAGRLTDALVRRLETRGGTVRCSSPVRRVVIRNGRAVAVTLADGTAIDTQRAVVADVGAPALYRDLVGEDHLPPRVVADVARFRYDFATFKVDWALDGTIPWRAEAASRAGTVHLADDMDALGAYAADLSRDRIPEHPYVVLGQMNVADPTRSPAGTATVWAYTHVPLSPRGDAGGNLRGKWDSADAEAFSDRLEGEVEARAPGFRDRVTARHVLTPAALEALDANLVGGALGGGTMALSQQLFWRPVTGLGRAETPIRGLYLASASAHPGGGVHGACGANAARAALAADRVRRLAGHLAMRGPR